MLRSISLLLVLYLGSQLAIADPPSTITQQDRYMLKEVYNTFKPRFDIENNTTFKQFAVLYYGGPNVSQSITQVCLNQTYGSVFLTYVFKDFNVNTCAYIGARLLNVHHHTEQIIFDSLLNGTMFNCPKSAGNMYLYSANTPCTGCITKWIQYFVKACSSRTRRMIIGYTYPYQEEESQKLIDALTNAAMTKI